MKIVGLQRKLVCEEIWPNAPNQACDRPEKSCFQSTMSLL